MPYLPNELWLEILSYCQKQDSWGSLRSVNRQLRDCVEQYFADEVLPQIVISLPITLPTYDIRQPMRGHARLHCCEGKLVSGRAVYAFTEAVPAYYEVHFLARWKRAYDACGHLPANQRWDIQLGSMDVSAHLDDARVEGVPESGYLSFEWKSTMTALLPSR